MSLAILPVFALPDRFAIALPVLHALHVARQAGLGREQAGDQADAEVGKPGA